MRAPTGTDLASSDDSLGFLLHGEPRVWPYWRTWAETGSQQDKRWEQVAPHQTVFPCPALPVYGTDWARWRKNTFRLWRSALCLELKWKGLGLIFLAPGRLADSRFLWSVQTISVTAQVLAGSIWMLLALMTNSRKDFTNILWIISRILRLSYMRNILFRLEIQAVLSPVTAWHWPDWQTRTGLAYRMLVMMLRKCCDLV